MGPMRLSLLALAAVLVSCARGGPERTVDASGLDGSVGLDAWVPPGTDAWVPPGTDAWTPPVDAWVPPGTDGGPPMGTRAYLDRCTTDADCASGHCADDLGPTRFCTRSCTSDGNCAHEHICLAGLCQADDTGAPCTSPAACATGMCLGTAAAGQCTRTCSSAAECPAGFACTIAGGSTSPICVDIEKPCTAAGSECGTGLCIPTLGCTATCRTAADCPGRFSGLPAYTCEIAFGSTSPICAPPSDILGSDPIGASCPATGLNTCRSDGCDATAPLGPMCTQACTALGGCAPGLGCYPLYDGTAPATLACERAGSADLGQACGTSRDCRSGLCDTAGYCTRLCADGLCPSDMACTPIPGAGVALCRR